MSFQHEGLEKPGRMREMPFRRARVLHRLNRHILGAEGTCEFQRKTACFEQAVHQELDSILIGRRMGLKRHEPRHADPRLEYDLALSHWADATDFEMFWVSGQQRKLPVTSGKLCGRPNPCARH